MDLAVKVLNLPRRLVQSALHDKKEIQPASLKVLKTWQEKQENAQEAFSTLCASLRKNNMNQLASELSGSTKASRIPSKLSESSEYFTYSLNIFALFRDGTITY